MSELPPFTGFPKIARLRRDIIITEKIDGTNAQVFIEDDGTTIHFGSRTRWLSETSDNHGFWKWGHAHEPELLTLGPGHHFGEWWGLGIQRRYDLQEKRFSLFNTYRWSDALDVRPACCAVVPVLYEGPFDFHAIDEVLCNLRTGGSVASPGFLKPEGIIVYHAVSKTYFKQTIDNDEVAKGQTNE